ncbi:MAG: holin [Oscillospiraceae bacterium]|nr:holin [Oscillospiraceae bacterium]
MDGIMLIAEGAFKLLLGFAAAIVIPLLVSKLGAQRMEKLAFWVEIFVRAAEQTFAGTEGAAKKAYVLRLLQERGIDIDAAEVDAMIEGAVQVLHSTLHGGARDAQQP